MTPPRRIYLRMARMIALLAPVAAQPCAGAGDESRVTTVVSSRVSPGYARTRLPDGSYQPESYTFGNGGHWTGTVSDGSIDRVVFMDVARAIVGPLADHGYVSSTNPKATSELIMVYWGRTTTPERFESTSSAALLQRASSDAAAVHSANAQFQTFSGETVVPPAVAMPCGKFDPSTTSDQVTGQIDADNAMSGALSLVAAEDRSRDKMDARNASLLGYDSWWNSMADFKGTPLEHRRQDMIDELEHDRYFVILMAYDFQAMWRHKVHKLLWETRFSVRQRGVAFDRDLPLIVKNASKYFGQDSHGLLREDLPQGRVDVGPLQTLGTVASK